MPESSNDLLLEMLREFLRERSQDAREGITLRSVNRQITQHVDGDDRRHLEIETRLRDLERLTAKTEGVMDTGRFHVPPVGSVNISGVGDNRKSRSDRPSIVVAALKQPAIVSTLIGAATLVAHLLLRLLH